MKAQNKFDPQVTLKHLQALVAMRGESTARDKAPNQALANIKAWQSERLAATYADLRGSARYANATQFFLKDLYGDRDHSQRDKDLLRVFPTMVKVLPEQGVMTAARAIEVDLLSETLDRRLAASHGDRPVSETSYCEAYRAAGTQAERERQIELILDVGERLDALVNKAWLYATLKLMRAPAKAAGLGELQSFLERGADAFKSMNGATVFLQTIATRERKIAQAIFSSSPRPLQF
jgi:hypothetical protein